MKTRKFCPHCGRPLVRSTIEDYRFQCHGCDEDFYRYEVFSTKQIDIVRKIRKRAYEYEREQGCPHVSFKRPYLPLYTQKVILLQRKLNLANSGEWRDKAISFLERTVNIGYEYILEFVSLYWENLDSDQHNLHNFHEYVKDVTKPLND